MNKENIIEREREENSRYLHEQIITYLGNKRALLKAIQKRICICQQKLHKNKTINLDLFSGSGIVSRLFKKYSSLLISNDLEGYSKTLNKCYLTNENEINWNEYDKYNSILQSYLKKNSIKGLISKNYSPKNDKDIKINERTFYTNRNAIYIDTALKKINTFPNHIKHFFLAPLIVECSIKTNTSGVFKGFYKDSNSGKGKFGGNGEYDLKRIKGKINIKKPLLSRFNCKTKIYKNDANKLAKKLKNIDIDIAYLDPPYNQHPYGSNYFMLNIINENKISSQLSKISGIPNDWKKSKYNSKKSAVQVFDNLIKNLNAKYILVSYNSEGIIKEEEMFNLLKKYGSVEKDNIPYITFRGCRNLAERDLSINEFIFMLEKK